MGILISQVRWPAEVYERIKAEAAARGVSVNAFIVEAGKRYLTEIDASVTPNELLGVTETQEKEAVNNG